VGLFASPDHRTQELTEELDLVTRGLVHLYDRHWQGESQDWEEEQEEGYPEGWGVEGLASVSSRGLVHLYDRHWQEESQDWEEGQEEGYPEEWGVEGSASVSSRGLVRLYDRHWQEESQDWEAESEEGKAEAEDAVSFGGPPRYPAPAQDGGGAPN
jgi:hypothetical protein